MKKYIVIAIFLIPIFFFKPLSIYFANSYFSSLLDKNVEFISFSVFPLKATAIIGSKSNIISADVITLFPLKALAKYDGDINAFSKFHQPFSAPLSSATATIYYDKEFVVEGTAYIYDSKTDVVVKKLNNGWFDWYVYTDTSSLHVEKLLKSAINKDLLLDLKLALNILRQKDKSYGLDYEMNSSIFVPKIQQIALDSNGTYHNNILESSSSHVGIKEIEIAIDKLTIDTKKILVSLQSDSFGGTLNASYKNGFVDYNAKNLHLSKLLKITKQKPFAKGYINLLGKLDIKNKTTNLTLNSQKLFSDDAELNKLHVEINNLKYIDKKLSSSYRLDAEILNKPFTCKGKIKYKENLDLTAFSDVFNGTTEFHLRDDIFQLSSKDLNITEIEEFISTDHIVSGLLNLNAKGNFEKFNYVIDAKTILQTMDVALTANGFYDVSSNLLSADFNTSTPLKNDTLKVRGTLQYDKHFNLFATSSNFDANSIFKLNHNHFEFYTNDINLKKLSLAFELNPIFGHLDFKAKSKSSYKDIDFSIYSEGLKYNMLLGTIDRALALDLTGNYKPKHLSLKKFITLIYKKEIIPIQVDADINLLPPYKAKASFRYNNDMVLINSFSYEHQQIKSDFVVDISELNKYRNLTHTKLYGPMKIEGIYTDTLNITSSTLGGTSLITIDKNILTANLNKLNISKISRLFAKEKYIHNGVLDGNISYDLKLNKAKTDINAHNVVLNGIDLDKLLSTLNDALSLDVIAITRSVLTSKKIDKDKKTDIQDIQLNLSLEDKKVELDDVAFATNLFRIAAVGNIKDNGDINKLDVDIIDRNGCAIITQGFKGNIQNPIATKKTTAIVKIATNIPSAIFGTGKKILDFTANTVDGVATLGTQLLGSDKNISVVSNITDLSTTLLSSTAHVIIPEGCSIAYDGEVKHPKEIAKSKKHFLNWKHHK